MLTPGDALHPTVAQWLLDEGAETTYLAGGTAALSAEVRGRGAGPAAPGRS